MKRNTINKIMLFLFPSIFSFMFATTLIAIDTKHKDNELRESLKVTTEVHKERIGTKFTKEEHSVYWTENDIRVFFLKWQRLCSKPGVRYIQCEMFNGLNKRK